MIINYQMTLNNIFSFAFNKYLIKTVYCFKLNKDSAEYINLNKYLYGLL